MFCTRLRPCFRSARAFPDPKTSRRWTTSWTDTQPTRARGFHRDVSQGLSWYNGDWLTMKFMGLSWGLTMVINDQWSVMVYNGMINGDYWWIMGDWLWLLVMYWMINGFIGDFETLPTAPNTETETVFGVAELGVCLHLLRRYLKHYGNLASTKKYQKWRLNHQTYSKNDGRVRI